MFIDETEDAVEVTLDEQAYEVVASTDQGQEAKDELDDGIAATLVALAEMLDDGKDKETNKAKGRSEKVLSKLEDISKFGPGIGDLAGPSKQFSKVFTEAESLEQVISSEVAQYPNIFLSRLLCSRYITRSKT